MVTFCYAVFVAVWKEGDVYLFYHSFIYIEYLEEENIRMILYGGD